MTGLRLTRRRLLGGLGAVGTGAGGLYAVPSRTVSASVTTYEYLVSAREVADVPTDASVGEWENLAGAERELLAEADDESVRRQSLPASVRSVADRYDYVHRGDEFLSVELDRPGTWPLSVEVAVPDAETREFDPAWIELTVTNEGEQPLRLQSQPPAPFGVPRGEPIEGSGETDEDLTLWSRSYAESGEAVFAGDRVDRSLALVLENATVAPGERRTGRYALRRNPGRLGRGTYRFRAGFTLGRPADDPERGWDGEPIQYPVDLDVTVERPK